MLIFIILLGVACFRGSYTFGRVAKNNYIPYPIYIYYTMCILYIYRLLFCVGGYLCQFPFVLLKTWKATDVKPFSFFFLHFCSYTVYHVYSCLMSLFFFLLWLIVVRDLPIELKYMQYIWFLFILLLLITMQLKDNYRHEFFFFCRI